MKQQQAAEILSKMEPDRARKITKTIFRSHGKTLNHF